MSDLKKSLYIRSKAAGLPMKANVVRTKTMAMAVFFGPVFAAMTSYACIRPSHVASALEVAEVTCILLNDRIDDESALAKACNISDALLPEIRKILFARKASANEHAKMAASACPQASGTNTVASVAPMATAAPSASTSAKKP